MNIVEDRTRGEFQYQYQYQYPYTVLLLLHPYPGLLLCQSTYIFQRGLLLCLRFFFIHFNLKGFSENKKGFDTLSRFFGVLKGQKQT